MKCPYCSYEESKVIDSRSADDGERIRRRRECLRCGKRFTTHEVIETVPIIVVKRDKSREVFDRNKLTGGILRACEKRPVSIEQIENMVNDIEAQLQSSLDREITSKQIGELAMDQLKNIDEVSYVRFASVYLNINDPKAFAEMIEQALREAPAAADEDAAGLETGEFYGVPETDESVEVADSPIELSDDSDPKGQLASSDPDGYIRKYR